MKVPAIALLLAAASIAPVRALAAGALGEARGAVSDPAAFDGARTLPAGEAVPAGSPEDRRTPGQIAKDEQAKADARAGLSAAVTGPDKEIEPPKPKEWLKSTHIFTGVKVALIGIFIGSLWGMAGLGIGAVIGGLIGYGLSRYNARSA